MSRRLLDEDGGQQRFDDGHSQVSGDWGLRIWGRGARGPSSEPPDVELIAAGAAGVKLSTGPVQRVAAQRELIILSTGGKSRIHGAAGVWIKAERIKTEKQAYTPQLTSGRFYDCKRKATWSSVSSSTVSSSAALFVGEHIGLAIDLDGDALGGMRWLHKYQYPILGAAKGAIELWLPRAGALPASWYSASNPLKQLTAP